MVRCNLSVLLAEQNLKITKVSQDTGISRTTLTALANNYSQGIQFDTLNTLCMYLTVSPNELISYAPFDVTVCKVAPNPFDVNIYRVTLEIKEKSKVTSTDILLLEAIFNNDSSDFLKSVNMFAFLESAPAPEFEKDNLFLLKIFSEFSRAFLTDLQSKITAMLLSYLEVKNDISTSFEWDSELC